MYKTTQVQVIEERNYKRRKHFCNWYLQAVNDSVLYSELIFFTNKAWYISAQNNMYWSSINLRQAFEVPLHDQKIGVQCAITATQIVGPIFF
jgi:hypothetical protein